MAARDDLAALAQRLEEKAATTGNKTHLGTAAGVRLAAFRLIELADRSAGTASWHGKNVSGMSDAEVQAMAAPSVPHHSK